MAGLSMNWDGVNCTDGAGAPIEVLAYQSTVGVVKYVLYMKKVHALEAPPDWDSDTDQTWANLVAQLEGV